jgi:hypothetical protein
MSIENPFANEEKSQKFEELNELRKEMGVPDKITEKMPPHKKDIVVNLPKGYDSKKRIEKIIEKRRREKENN